MPSVYTRVCIKKYHLNVIICLLVKFYFKKMLKNYFRKMVNEICLNKHDFLRIFLYKKQISFKKCI